MSGRGQRELLNIAHDIKTIIGYPNIQTTAEAKA